MVHGNQLICRCLFGSQLRSQTIYRHNSFSVGTILKNNLKDFGWGCVLIMARIALIEAT